MQCGYDSRGNSVPKILLLMQERLYAQGGLKVLNYFYRIIFLLSDEVELGLVFYVGKFEAKIIREGSSKSLL
jgi:hypothetical protein